MQKMLTGHSANTSAYDILFPEEVIVTTASQFDTDIKSFAGYELILEEGDLAFLVGYNRYDDGQPMYGRVQVLGSPVQSF